MKRFWYYCVNNQQIFLEIICKKKLFTRIYFYEGDWPLCGVSCLGEPPTAKLSLNTDIRHLHLDEAFHQNFGGGNSQLPDLGGKV